MKAYGEALRDFGFWLSRIISYPLVEPDAIQIPLTNKCNLRCKMCAIPLAPENKELAGEEIGDIISQAGRMKIREAVLTGGEPFLRKDLTEIIKCCVKNGLRSVLTSNGTIIDETIAQDVICSGLSHIHFSLDGLEKANDFTRGDGNFKKVIQTIKIMDGIRRRCNSGLSIGIACTVMNHNLEDLPGLLGYADELNVDVINFQPLLNDNSNTCGGGESRFWLDADRLSAIDEVIEKIKIYKRRGITLYEEPSLRLLGKYYRKNLSASDWKCFGGYKTIFICVGSDNSRLVYTCHGICGNLAEKSLRECWFSLEARRLREKSKKCRNLCLQCCYSRRASESLAGIFN